MTSNYCSQVEDIHYLKYGFAHILLVPIYCIQMCQMEITMCKRSLNHPTYDDTTMMK